MLAVGEKGYPKWADRSDGCWVLIGESKVWVEEHHFRHLEVIDV